MAARNVSAIRIALEGWRLGFVAIFKLPVLFVTAFVLRGLGDFLHSAYFGPRFGSPNAVAAIITADIIRTLVSASVSMAVYRALLLGDLRDRPVWQVTAGYGRFVAWSLLFNLGTILLGRAMLLGPDIARLAAPLIMVGIYPQIRSMLLFPAIAIEVPGATIGTAWRRAISAIWRRRASGITAVVGLCSVGMV